MARQLLEKAPAPKSLYLIPGADHNDTYFVGGGPYWQQWQDFLGGLAIPAEPSP
jgi:hypothetical protein